jgi:hypothetical protein
MRTASSSSEAEASVRAATRPAPSPPRRAFGHALTSGGPAASPRLSSRAASSARDHSRSPSTKGPEQAVRIAARRHGARQLRLRGFLSTTRTAVAGRRAGRGCGCRNMGREDAIQRGDALLEVGRVDVLAVANDRSRTLALRYAIARDLRLARLVAAFLALLLTARVRRRGT